VTDSTTAIEGDARTPAPSLPAMEANHPEGIGETSLQNLGTHLLSKRGLILALVFLVLVAFANSLAGSFVHDDSRVIQANPLFGHWDRAAISRPFKYDVWTALSPDEAGDKVDSFYYRPMFVLFLMAGYQVAERSPLRWHWIVLLLHAAVGILVFVVMDKSLAAAAKMDDKNRRLLAALTAGIYVVHPAQSESVAWIAGLVNPLGTVFLLGAFYFYLSYREKPEKPVARLTAALGLFAMAVLSKESTITLVLIVAAYELFIFNREAGFLKRARVAATQAAPYALVAVAYMTLRYSVLKVLSGHHRNLNFPDDFALTVADNLRTVPALLMGYMKIAFLPVNLSFMYDFGYVRSLGLMSFWMPLVVLFAAIGLLVYLSKRMPEVRLAAIWMVVPLLPHLSTLVFTSDEIIHDRYLYLPMAGVALLLAALLTRARRIAYLPLPNRSVALASALVLGILCVGTVAQNRQWRNEESLWSSAAVHAPNSRTVHIALGFRAEQKEDLPGALREYEAALRINPDIIDALNSAGFVHARLGQWDQASRYFERIVSLTPNKAVAHFNLSFAYAVQKRYEDAAREQGAAIDLDPGGPRAKEWRARMAQLEKTIAATATVNPRDK
jgi:hypothetical protein